MSVRVLLADDHQIIRDGLKSLLSQQHDIDVVGEADTGRNAIRMVQELQPDVVVMDIGMPDLNGVEATRQIVREDPRLKVIALSMQSDGPVIRRMFAAGAKAYLLKDCASDELVRAIRAVAGGRTYVSPEVGGVVVQQMTRAEPDGDHVLTPREREVLQLVAEGKSSKEIAKILSVSVKTIDTHRQHTMNKLGMHNIAELTKYAIRQGLTTLEK